MQLKTKLSYSGKRGLHRSTSIYLHFSSCLRTPLGRENTEKYQLFGVRERRKCACGRISYSARLDLAISTWWMHMLLLFHGRSWRSPYIPGGFFCHNSCRHQVGPHGISNQCQWFPWHFVVAKTQVVVRPCGNFVFGNITAAVKPVHYCCSAFKISTRRRFSFDGF